MPSFSVSENPVYPPFKTRDQFLPKKTIPVSSGSEREMAAHNEFILPKDVKNGWMTSAAGLKEYAKKFISVERESNLDTQLVRRADFQNRIIRAFFAGEIGNISTYRKQLNDFILDLCAEMKLPNLSQGVSRVFDGIEPAIHAIQNDKSGFTKQEGVEQVIGLNEILDAHHSIDYVEFKYDAEKGIVSPVRLVQVKRSQMTDSSEINNIRRKHQEYVNGLLSQAALDILIAEPARKKQKEFLSGALFAQEMMNLHEEEKILYVEKKLMEVFYALLDMPNFAVNQSDIEHLSEACLISVPFIKLLLLQTPSNELTEIASILADASGVEETKFLLQISDLKRWIDTTGLSSAECLLMNANWQAPPILLPTTQFESVIYHGGQQMTAIPFSVDTSLTIN